MALCAWRIDSRHVTGPLLLQLRRARVHGVGKADHPNTLGAHEIVASVERQ
jgi:hypothetical protein